MDRIILGTDIVMNMIKIYQFKGKEFYYHEVFADDVDSIGYQIIEKETIYLAKIFGVQLTDQRTKLLLKKDAVAKNKDEHLFINIKKFFILLHEDADKFEYNPNQFIDMCKFIFKNVRENNGFDTKIITVNNNSLFPEKKKVSKRDELEEFLGKYTKMLRSGQYELTLLITNFYVDFVFSKFFKEENEKLGYFVLYALLFKEGFELFRYTSFFELIYNELTIFEQNVLQAGFNWEKGYSQTAPLHQQIVSILLKGYNSVENLLRDYEFDRELNKSDNIENTINKFGEIFTKEDIRARHPYVSDSTINRTLKRLRDEKKISPLGVGRSAKWIKLYKDSKTEIYKQLGLFEDND